MIYVFAPIRCNSAIISHHLFVRYVWSTGIKNQMTCFQHIDGSWGILTKHTIREKQAAKISAAESFKITIHSDNGKPHKVATTSNANFKSDRTLKICVTVCLHRPITLAAEHRLLYFTSSTGAKCRGERGRGRQSDAFIAFSRIHVDISMEASNFLRAYDRVVL